MPKSTQPIIGALSNQDIKVQITELNSKNTSLPTGLNEVQRKRLNDLTLEQTRRNPFRHAS